MKHIETIGEDTIIYNSFTEYLKTPPHAHLHMDPNDIRIDGNQLPKIDIPKTRVSSGTMTPG